MKKKIRNISLRSHKKSRRVLTKPIQDADISVSNITERRRLKEQGIEVWRSVKKPKATKVLNEK